MGKKSSIVQRWLKEPFGMSGWRIDVGNMTGRYYGDNFNREIAQSIRTAMDEVNPDAWLVAENADLFCGRFRWVWLAWHYELQRIY